MDIKENKKKILSTLVFISMLAGALLVVVFVYNQRNSDYSSLFGEDYQALLDDIGNPVIDPIIPTIEQVNSWLAIDGTNDILYVEDVWMCGNYAARLTVNAKQRSWRMYVVILFYSLEGESKYSLSNPEGNAGHAFNLIYCQDGDDEGDELDIWYIEPQSDGSWRLDNGHYIVYNYYFGLSGTIWEGTIYWINYYEYVG